MTTATLSWRARRKRRPTLQLQRVLHAAASVVSGTHKFDRGLSRLLHTELHWLDVPERVVYKLGVIVFDCLHGQALPHLVDLCQPVAGVARTTATSPIRHPTAPGRTVPPAQLLWPTGFVWAARRSGIPYRTACRIRLLAGRHFCSQRTDVISALEVSRRCAI